MWCHSYKNHYGLIGNFNILNMNLNALTGFHKTQRFILRWVVSITIGICTVTSVGWLGCCRGIFPRPYSRTQVRIALGWGGGPYMDWVFSPYLTAWVFPRITLWGFPPTLKTETSFFVFSPLGSWLRVLGFTHTQNEMKSDFALDSDWYTVKINLNSFWNQKSAPSGLDFTKH